MHNGTLSFSESPKQISISLGSHSLDCQKTSTHLHLHPPHPIAPKYIGDIYTDNSMVPSVRIVDIRPRTEHMSSSYHSMLRSELGLGAGICTEKAHAHALQGPELDFTQRSFYNVSRKHNHRRRCFGEHATRIYGVLIWTDMRRSRG